MEENYDAMKDSAKVIFLISNIFIGIIKIIKNIVEAINIQLKTNLIWTWFADNYWLHLEKAEMTNVF